MKNVCLSIWICMGCLICVLSLLTCVGPPPPNQSCSRSLNHSSIHRNMRCVLYNECKYACRYRLRSTAHRSVSAHFPRRTMKTWANRGERPAVIADSMCASLYKYRWGPLYLCDVRLYSSCAAWNRWDSCVCENASAIAVSLHTPNACSSVVSSLSLFPFMQAEWYSVLGVYAHRSLVRTSLKQTRDKSMQLRMSERVCDARVFQYRSLCGSVVLLYKHRKAHKLTHTHWRTHTRHSTPYHCMHTYE